MDDICNESSNQKYLSYLSSNISQQLIESRIPNNNYLITQLANLDKKCPESTFEHVYSKKNFFKSKNAKNLCRSGIPLKYMKTFFYKLLHLENCVENYNTKYELIIKENKPENFNEYVPYFCGSMNKTLSVCLPVHYLNEKGIINLKIIMWMLMDLIPKIEYCPLIIKLTSIFLTFLEKEEAYEAMRILLEMNYKPSELYKLRWHLRFSKGENDKLISTISNFLSEQGDMKNIYEHFSLINFNPEILIRSFAESLFIDYFNFYGVLRVFPIFIYEGAKSLYRISYSLIKSLESDIHHSNVPDIMLDYLKQKAFDIVEFTKLFQVAFELSLSRFNNHYVTKNSQNVDVDTDIPFECLDSFISPFYKTDYYLPSFEPRSNILSNNEILSLWQMLPTSLKHHDVSTIFSLLKKKTNLVSIYNFSKKYPFDTNILFLVQTDKNEVFGAIISNMLINTENLFVKPTHSYLVQIRPNVMIYEDKSENQDVLTCTQEFLSVGKGNNGCALSIDHKLEYGYCSQYSYAFGNVQLCSEEKFTIKNFEIYAFIEDEV